MELISKEEVLKIIKEETLEDEYECEDGSWESYIDFQYTDAVERINDLTMIFLGDELVCDTAVAWNKGYMAGIKERPKGKWIPTSEKLADFPCLACDKFGQIFIPHGVVTYGDKSFDGEFFNLDINEFLKGRDIGDGTRVLPIEIIAWQPLPEPYNVHDSEKGAEMESEE